ncbi:MAG: PfkB family carbohydrate kinase [Candidatus Limnocylindrales bacterium]
MIVVVGIPAWRAVDPSGPAGRACGVAIEAARRGARVELVGRTGDDPHGDALLLALTRAGVGHAAVLRDPVRPTPVLDPPPVDDAESVTGPTGGVAARADGPRLEPADVALGLSYLGGFVVLVVTDEVPATVLPAAAEAAAFAGAQLVVVVPSGHVPTDGLPDGLPDAATVLAAPDEVDDGAFDALVGAYAAALAAGTSPADAFAVATAASAWEALDSGG